MPFLRNRIGISQLDTNNPDHQQVINEWDLIWRYYFSSAPKSLSSSSSPSKIPQSLERFTPINPHYRDGKAFVTLVQIDSKRHQIYVGNAQTETLDVLDSDGRTKSTLAVDSPPVSLVEHSTGWYSTLIGRVPPHNERLGKVVRLNRVDDRFLHDKDLLTELPRPTDCRLGDLNQDGRDDLIVSGFGNILGELAWYENRGEDRYQKHVIYDRPGAVATQLHDFDHDGRLDLVALMAQAQEGVYIFLNNGNGQLAEFPAVQVHPAWGYAAFETVDFDRDGRIDVLTANGDNGEYPSCLKPYHGIRLYRNLPSGFKEQFFLPLNGAFKALPGDFDRDGDLDIASISYFPDYDHAPEESFVMWWNEGNDRFKPETFPNSYQGRWLTMDCGDLDNDGDLDLVLGAANRTPYAVDKSIEEQWIQKGPSILILRNDAVPPKPQSGN